MEPPRKDLKKMASTLRRRLADAANNISLIKDWGKKASSDPSDKESVAFFRGMLKNLETSYGKYEELWLELEALQDEGLENTPSSTDMDSRKSTRSHYFAANKYAQLIDMHMEEINKSREMTIVGAASGANESKIARSLPKLNLPSFDGTHSDWPSYRDTFRSLVESDAFMPRVNKLHYLRSSLKGPAFSLISHLAISEDNFALAWKAVQDAYDNKRMLASTYLDKIISAKPGNGKGTAESLKHFLASIGDSVSGLKLLKIENQSEYILFYLSVRALDPVTRELFETQNKVDFPTVDDLITFVRERATSLLLASTGSAGASNTQPARDFRQQQPPRPKNFTKSNSTNLLVQDQKTSRSKEKKPESQKPQQNVRSLSINSSPASKHPPCFICKNVHHHLLSCERFHLAAVEEKWKLIRGWTGCVNCLNPNHSVQNCPSTWKCRFCPERHHSSLHQPAISNSLNYHAASGSDSPGTSHALNTTSQEEGQVILGTAIVELLDARGEHQLVRAVLDSGSQNSFITHKCLNRLGLNMQNLRRRISGIGQTPYEGAKGKTTCILRPRNRPTLQLRTDAIVVSSITSFLPASTLSLEFANRCARFELADPGFWKPSTIDFLIGADLFAQIMTGSVVPIEGSQASLFSSVFGYVVLGKVDAPQAETSCSLFSMSREDDLNVQLKKFWELEDTGTPQAFNNPEDERCEEHFMQTHSRHPDGRYIIRLPFKSNPPEVGDSSYIAQKRFSNLERKLQANPLLKQAYHEVISEYLALDHLTPATEMTRFIIPHHCVSKEENGLVKPRVVFDASVSVPGGSLNENLMVGEKLQRDIRDVVLSFRQHEVVFSADIVKMFRMITVDQADRGFLHILWRFTKEEEVQLFELKALPFGLVSSPFIALRVLKQLCQDHGKDHPLAARALRTDIYVDDVLTGAPTGRQAVELKNELVALLQKGGFELSKWVSNSQEILESVEGSSIKPVVSLSDKEDMWVKLLGLQWDPVEDVFLFALQTPSPVYSKRGILSAIARLYDPTGFLTPVTMLMKGIVQDLWKLRVDWDAEIPTNLKTLWEVILSELHFLSSLRIPRFLHTSGHYEGQVVGFSDASLKGYAAVLYVRVLTSNQEWKVSFLTAKSRLAPTKAISIPRLELCGALLLTQLYAANQEFIHSLPAPFSSPQFHTDSSIVLSWLHTPAYKLQTFVANRVSQILEVTPLNTWRHINSQENPSDIASRGVLPSQLPSDELWWNGPSWLTASQEDWPSPAFKVTPDLPELKQNSVTCLATYQENPWVPWMKKHSSFQKILRVVAWVNRWIFNLKHTNRGSSSRRTGPLRLLEIDLARDLCIRWVQDNHLLQGRPFSVVTERFAQLQPFLDSKGIIRVGGRIKRASISHAQRFPILMPTEAHLTNLMVDYYHQVYLHPGPNLLQAIIQKTYWVPSLRRLIRARGFKCHPCYRSKAKAATPLMGDLPTYRVNGGRAFLHVGVDFAGPFQIRESLRRKAPVNKAYLCLFVCMATKALHLEVVTRLSTDAFLAALDRFTSRRGLPSDIYSDRGSNFVGAARYLNELHHWFRSQETMTELINYATKQHISWHFNPPLTPHMGGIWEAGVKSVKGHLLKVAGDRVLTLEEMVTLFCKIEAILNSRPLCPLSASPEETNYLSPGHFLVGAPLVATPEPSLLDLKENVLDRWQLVSALGQRFWKRWQAEYLSTLQMRPKWMRRQPNIRVGDIVLLKEESPPRSWPIAKVVEVSPGQDGIVRVATIRTAKGTYQRPAVKLIPLLPLQELKSVCSSTS